MKDPSSRPLREHDGETVESSFGLLQGCLKQLKAPVETPEEILRLVPDVDQTNKRLILVELIKADLLAASKVGLQRKLEFYWPTFEKDLPQNCISLELLLQEVQLRRAAGDEPKWDEYQERFPDLAETIGRWLARGNTAVASSPTRSVPELPIGEQVDDFFILKLLGTGAFAGVYLARQESMQRLVALKVTTRGSEEPQALSRLDHPNVVRVYDQRTLSLPASIVLYMQYLPGGTLSDCIGYVSNVPPAEWNGQKVLESIDRCLLAASQSVPEQSSVRRQIAEFHWPEVVAWIGIQLAEGLDYAYGKGVLHRDVKPANILLSGEAIPKLADFNVSTTGPTSRGGAAAYFGGSLAYMSPEQLKVAHPDEEFSAEQLDGRSDLYALAIVLWELWQGQRPWGAADPAYSWKEAVELQIALRLRPLQTVRPSATASDRVMESVLRRILVVDREQRPKSGREVAARLRLALYPELARRFEPPRDSLAARLFNMPVLLLAALLIFGPNTAASVSNYFYNWSRMAELEEIIPKIEQDFTLVANWVNGVVFPLGAILFLIIMLPIRKIISKSRRNEAATEDEISKLWNIGNRATLICGILWAVSGFVFAIVFRSMHSEFNLDDAFHFFISLVLCGGVAWIYPYFGMTLLSVLIYYPKVIAQTMDDPKFEERSARLRKHSSAYLLSAAAIPLAGVGLMVFRQNLPREIILVGVCITLLGLLASHYANQKLDHTLQEFSRVLGSESKR